MYWQQRELLPQFFTSEIELLGEKEVLHNIVFKFGVCRVKIINLTFLMRFSPDLKILSFPGFA